MIIDKNFFSKIEFEINLTSINEIFIIKKYKYLKTN